MYSLRHLTMFVPRKRRPSRKSPTPPTRAAGAIWPRPPRAGSIPNLRRNMNARAGENNTAATSPKATGAVWFCMPQPGNARQNGYRKPAARNVRRRVQAVAGAPDASQTPRGLHAQSRGYFGRTGRLGPLYIFELCITRTSNRRTRRLHYGT